jgi:hypothetical protein
MTGQAGHESTILSELHNIDSEVAYGSHKTVSVVFVIPRRAIQCGTNRRTSKATFFILPHSLAAIHALQNVCRYRPAQL